MADKDTIVSPISAYINKPIYYLAYNKFGSFFFNPRTNFINNQSKIIDKIKPVIKNITIKSILILGYPLDVKTNELKFTKLKDFNKNIVAEKRYYIYLLEVNQ